jgi:hypothetical protein
VNDHQAKPIIRLSGKSEKLNIRCSPDLKRAVAIAAIDRNTTIETLCVELIATGLGYSIERETADAA